MPFFPELLHAAADLVFPPGCAGCDVAISWRELPWCPQCAAEMVDAVTGTYCPLCGLPVGPGLSLETGCTECREQPLRLDGMARVGLYHGKAGELLKKFKFGRQHRLDRLLGELLVASVARWTWHERLDALVPVPTDWPGRWRYRGHPAGLLAAALAGKLRVPNLPLLRCIGKRQRQTELSNTDRAVNVRGKFHLAPHARVAGARICIVDDVSTTGATLREVARVLRAAGAAEVYAAVVCRTAHDRSDTF